MSDDQAWWGELVRKDQAVAATLNALNYHNSARSDFLRNVVVNSVRELPNADRPILNAFKQMRHASVMLMAAMKNPSLQAEAAALWSEADAAYRAAMKATGAPQ